MKFGLLLILLACGSKMKEPTTYSQLRRHLVRVQGYNEVTGTPSEDGKVFRGVTDLGALPKPVDVRVTVYWRICARAHLGPNSPPKEVILSCKTTKGETFSVRTFSGSRTLTGSASKNGEDEEKHYFDDPGTGNHELREYALLQKVYVVTQLSGNGEVAPFRKKYYANWTTVVIFHRSAKTKGRFYQGHE